jgi:hypothetical protein
MVAQMIRARMQERTERLSERIRAARPVVLVQQVERTQVVICCGVNGRGMGLKSRFACRAPRRHGRF